jgi:hypothetical protein
MHASDGEVIRAPKTIRSRACSSIARGAEGMREVVRKARNGQFSKSTRIGVRDAQGTGRANTCNNLLVLQEFIDFIKRFS